MQSLSSSNNSMLKERSLDGKDMNKDNNENSINNSNIFSKKSKVHVHNNNLWDTLNWINSHPQYACVGCALAEYATKTAISYLPKSQASMCLNLFKTLGVDIENVGVGTIGKNVLQLAITQSDFKNNLNMHIDNVPIVYFECLPSNIDYQSKQITSNEPRMQSTLDNLQMHCTSDELQGQCASEELGMFNTSDKLQRQSVSNVFHVKIIVSRILELARLPLVGMEQEHLNFAIFLYSQFLNQENILNSQYIIQSSLHFYHGSFWLEVALSGIHEYFYSSTIEKIKECLEEAYIYWVIWARKHAIMIMQLSTAI